MSLTATIERLAFGGNGVCRIDGKVCFVPFSCPGDEVSLEVVSSKKSYMTARIVDLLRPSPQRVTPACPVFGRCGGCTWQQVSYAAQLAEKRAIFADALWRGVRIEPALVADVIASPRQYGYRSRVQFKLHAATGRLQMGFFRAGSHFVEDAPEGCPIALPVINEAAAQLRRVIERFSEGRYLPQVNVECGDSGVVAVVNYIGQHPDQAADYFGSCRDELPAVSGLWLQAGRKHSLSRVWGDDTLYYRLPSADGEVQLGFTPGGFSQVNSDQNQAILTLIRRMGSFSSSEQLLDLYCGNGNFSIPLAGEVASVTGVEGYQGSIDSALENVRLNSIGNARYICNQAYTALEEFLAAGQSFDVVLLDPPRSGAAESVESICRLKPQKVIYVSCDPSTLARDCGMFSGRGYRVIESVPLDMFPQTSHLESVTLLTRSS